MMVSQTNPLGFKLFFYANTFFCFSNPIWLLVTWVKTLHTDRPLSLPHTWGKSWANCLARRFAQQFPHVCGEIVVRNSPREAVRIKSNMFDIFGLARQIPQCVRPSWESSWAWFNQASNKNTWHTHVTPEFKMVSEEEIPTSLKSCENAMYFYWKLHWTSSTRFSRWPHTMRNLPCEAKNIKHVWFFPHGLARPILHQTFPSLSLSLSEITFSIVDSHRAW